MLGMTKQNHIFWVMASQNKKYADGLQSLFTKPAKNRFYG